MKFLFFFVFCTFVFLNSISLHSKESSDEPSLFIKIEHHEEDLPFLQNLYLQYKNRLLIQPNDYDLKIHAAETIFYLVQLTDDKSKKIELLNEGIKWAQEASILKPQDPGGYFYYGILNGLKAQVGDLFLGLKLKNLIRDSMEKVITIAPSYSHGDALLALGDWYSEVPKVMGGDDEKAKDYFNQALEIAPDCSQPYVGIAKIYIQKLKFDLAKKQLQLVLNFSQKNSICEYENRKSKKEAEELLKKVEKRLSIPLRGFSAIHAHE
ncbi:MAG: hypothetical protein JNK65_02935 [Deltaproteobacteria bacterium]|nr:hypothetical protein [Deltaproteobacteria bacterium]